MFYDFSSQDKNLTTLKAKIPYKFKDEKNLKSAVGEAEFHDFSRLATIGDSLMNMVVKTTLGIEHPDWSSGQITCSSQTFLQNINSSSDKGSILCQIAEEIGLKEYFCYYSLYKGGYGLTHTHASAVEALVGAVFYDSENDSEIVRNFVLKLYQHFGLVQDKILTMALSNSN